jgi:calcineurin-like phosphoesterase family protein
MREPTYFFTSDTHFGHTRIIEYQKRPFENVQQMDDKLIAKWNALVRTDDVVYHLGDFSLGDEAHTRKVLKRLNGRKYLVLGNHDNGLRSKWPHLRGFFVEVGDYLEVTVGGQHIVLSHYPMISWHKIARGAWMLHGHCHHNLTYPFRGRIADVGVDGWEYAPVSLARLKKKLDAVVPEFLDHHRPVEKQ